jgi:hypothetical protein
MSRRAQLLGSTASSAPMSLAEIIRIVHALIEADDTVSGASGHAEWQETLHRRCHAAAGGAA